LNAKLDLTAKLGRKDCLRF